MTLEWNCLGIWETGIAALADALSVNQTLEELDLRNNKIGPQGGATLANQLKHNTTLRRLDLRWNNVGMIGGRAFLDVLKWNKTVLYVELAGNELPEDIAHAIGRHRVYQVCAFPRVKSEYTTLDRNCARAQPRNVSYKQRRITALATPLLHTPADQRRA